MVAVHDICQKQWQVHAAEFPREKACMHGHGQTECFHARGAGYLLLEGEEGMGRTRQRAWRRKRGGETEGGRERE